MKLGIKVGPQQQSILDLEETNAPFAEVWFRIDKKDDYDELFSFLKKRHIDTGLHFWGLTRDGIIPTLTYDDRDLLQESLRMFRQAIDIASQQHFSYVNIHPGYRARIACEFTNLIFSQVDASVTPLQRADKLFLEHMETLTTYAQAKNVILTVETTPIRLSEGSLHNLANRSHVKNFYEYSYIHMPTENLHFAIANDFGHTAANCMTDDAEKVWDMVRTKTLEYAPMTRLVHIGYIVPPYNGMDFHEQLDNPIVETPEAIPNKNQMVELLRLFKNRSDVWALVEPNGHHPKNYFLAQKLLAEANS